MPVTKCAKQIIEAAEGLITRDEAEALVKELRRRGRTGLFGGEPGDVASLLVKKAREMAQELTVEAQIRKRNELINFVKYKSLQNFMSNRKNKVKALESLLVGNNEYRYSVDARQKTIALQLKSGLMLDLKQAGLTELFVSEKYGRLIARELADLNNPEPSQNAITGNDKARQMAQIIQKWQNKAIERQNANGAWIRKLPGYVARTSHDMSKIKKAGYQKWREYISDKLDDQTFENVPDDQTEDFLQSVYASLSTGVHLKHADGNFDINSAFRASGSIAKRASQERLLHFKDADAWFDYNREFGIKDFRETIMNGFDHAANNIGLMEVFGTNPEGVLRRIKKEALAQVRTDPKQAQSLQTSGGPINNWLRAVDGTMNQVGHSATLAKVGTFVRNIQSMSKLGASTISSFSDLPLLASELKFQGINYLDSIGGELDALMRGRSRIDREGIARIVLAGNEGMLGEIHSRYSAVDNLPGKMSKAMYTYFKYNGQNWWNDTLKAYATSAMSANLALKSNMPWSKVDVDLKRVLAQFDIGEADWKFMKSMIHESETGNRYVMPEKALEIEGLDKAGREALKNKLDTYFVERSDFAIPTPGARERAMMLQGTQPGTWLGEAMRFVGQFKSFPITFLTKVYGRQMNLGQAGLAGLAQVIIGTTAMGYVSLQMKEMLKGRTPRKTADAKTWLAAFTQGGGGGIYGDYLFGEYNRYGRSFLSTLAGPTLGQADDIMELYQRARNGEDFGANAFRVAKNNTPFINLFYTRAAMDYLILYQLQENMNPGYLARMETRIQSENEQEFIYPPSQYSRNILSELVG